MGILACWTLRDLPSHQSWARLLRDFGLLALLARLMVPGMSQPDVLLEVVLVLSAAAAEPLVSDYIRPQTYPDHSSSYVYTCLFHQACEVIASSNVLGLAYQLLKDRLAGGAEARKTQDVEMVLQLLFLFYRCDTVTLFVNLFGYMY